MNIYIGSDHRGFELKNQLINWLKEHDNSVYDCGNQKFDPLDDYVNFSRGVVEKILAHPEAMGIVICGSGVGVSIVANRHKNIYCALGFNPDQIRHARRNDHINVLALPADYISLNTATDIIAGFIEEKPKSEAKYLRRIKNIEI